MFQLYEDSMALVCKFGKSDIFITITCSPWWQEIQNNLLVGQEAKDWPDLVFRVFKLKLDQFLNDLFKKQIFGRVKQTVHVIEIQKRELPHFHCLLILEDDKETADNSKPAAEESQPSILICEDKPTSPNKIPNIRIKLRPPPSTDSSNKKPSNSKPISLILKKANEQQENINVDQPKKLIKPAGSSLLVSSLNYGKSKFSRSGSSILKISTKSPSSIQSSSVQSLLSQSTHTEPTSLPEKDENQIDEEHQPKEEPKEPKIDDCKVEEKELKEELENGVLAIKGLFY